MGSWEVSYTYDSFGRRLSRAQGDVQINYLYQDQCELGAYCNHDLQQLRILGRGHGSDIGAAIAIEIEDKLYVPIHDHRGNVCCLLDGTTGVPEETYRYSAFGESLFLGNPTSNPWRYASKRLDTHTGLYHFGKREYDPCLGRWLTPDPAGFVDGPNLYAYVHNRPLSYIDPDGCFCRIPLSTSY